MEREFYFWDERLEMAKEETKKANERIAVLTKENDKYREENIKYQEENRKYQEENRKYQEEREKREEEWKRKNAELQLLLEEKARENEKLRKRGFNAIVMFLRNWKNYMFF